MPIYNEDPTRTTAALQAMAEALGRIGANRAFEIVVLSDSTNADAWIRETVAVDRLRRSLAAHHARLVSAALAQRRAQVGQYRGIRHALGRPLRSHDRARRRQPDRRADAAAARADDARGSAARDPADGSAAHRCAAPFSAGCSSSPPASTARSSRAVWRPGPATAAITGATTPSFACGLRGELRPARARGPQALRRPRAVARLRRGGAHAPRRMEGAHDHRLRRFLGRVAAVADRRRHSRPPLGAGQSAAHENHRRRGLELHRAGCISASAS